MPNTLVRTTSGPVQGSLEGSIVSWKGIPYAQPPLGNLRFRPPRPPEPWPGVRQATSFGPMAMQPPSMPAELLRRLSMSEDCLTLNIWAPGADSKLRPVLVWIHGGGWLIGSGRLYDGTRLSTLGDAVVVTLNYRLGPFGFLHLAEAGGEEYAASGNCGLLDQVAALQWVQDNIAAFGGDPHRVTIFGESAGAMSIATLLALPAAQGLFQRAILQSGAIGPIKTSSAATTLAHAFLKILEVSPQDLSPLEEIPAERLIKTISALPDWQGTTEAGTMIHFAPVIDGVVLPHPPLQAIARGVAKHIPLIIGTTRDECLFYPFADPTWREADDETLLRRAQQQVGDLWPGVAPFYLEDRSGEQPLLARLLTLLTFDQFVFPALQLAEAQVRQGAPVWFYRFDWNSPLFGGAAHTLDRIFVWDLADNPTIQRMTGSASERAQLTRHMQSAWLAFASRGDPTIPEFPTWPRYDLEQRATMLFDQQSIVQPDPHARARQLWANAVAGLPSS